MACVNASKSEVHLYPYKAPRAFEKKRGNSIYFIQHLSDIHMGCSKIFEELYIFEKTKSINLHMSETISFLRDIFVSTVDTAASWWQRMRRQLVCSSPYMKMHPHRNLTFTAQGHIPPDNAPTDTIWKIILDQSKCSFDLQIMLPVQFLSMLQNINQRFSDWFCPYSHHQTV